MLKLTAAAGLAALMGDAATTVTAAMRHFSLDPAVHGVETKSAGGGMASVRQAAP
jgi:formyltetrahydrofolate synthetase